MKLTFFKGSWADKSHGWIPLMAMPLSILIVYFTNISYQAAFVGLPFILILIQYINEKVQRSDPKLIDKYGSLENFIKNSRRDWVNFWKGLFVGMFIAAILAGVL